MNFRSLVTGTVALMLPSVDGLLAQQASVEDRDLAVFEARLQEQRADAIHSRLILYTDELQKLHSQFENSGDSNSAAAVKRELDAARFAVRRLELIARGQAEPPATEELKDGDAGNPTALAAKRINAIIARFGRAKSDGPADASRGVATGQPRLRTLKIEKASRNREYADSEGGKYWAHKSSFAAWAVDDMVPGDYEVILRYTAGENAGGTAIIKVAGQKLEHTVPKSEKGQSQREQKERAGVVSVKETGADIRIEHGGLAEGAEYLWNLEAVILQPLTRRP